METTDLTLVGQMVDELCAVAGPNDVGAQTREAFGHDVEEFGIVIRDEDARVERHANSLSNQHAEWHARERMHAVQPGEGSRATGPRSVVTGAVASSRAGLTTPSA